MNLDAPAPDRSVRHALWGAAALQARLLSGPRFTLVLAAVAAIPAGLAVVLPLILRHVTMPEEARRQWTLLFLYWAYVRALVPLVCLYVGASLWADETESGTLVYLVTRPVPRSGLLIAKFLVAWVVVVLIVSASAAAGVGALAVLADAPFAGLPALILACAVGALAYLGLFTLFGVLTSRGLVLGLVVLAPTDGIAWAVGFVARKLAIGHYTGSALARLGPYREVAREAMTGFGDPAGPWEAWGVLLGIAALALALAGALVHTREYAPTRTT